MKLKRNKFDFGAPRLCTLETWGHYPKSWGPIVKGSEEDSRENNKHLSVQRELLTSDRADWIQRSELFVSTEMVQAQKSD